MPADAHEVDWLGVSRAAAEALGDLLFERPTTADRVRETGTRGQGGDRTLIIDADAEAAVFAQLDRLQGEGLRFTAISEERGEVDYGSRDVLVVIDPIDGSINAKRGLPHHSISIAVADGPTMADVFFGFVHDYGPGEEWSAWRGRGAFLDGVQLPTAPAERRDGAGKLEVLGLESADPRWIAEVAGDLVGVAHRIRALGTMAVSLCQVAAARMDAMLSLKGTRAVDTAAAQLIVREAGGHVAYTEYADPLAAPLDTEPRSPVVAARTPQGVEDLRHIPRRR